MAAWIKVLKGGSGANIIAGFALLISLVSVGISTFQTTHANSISEEALRISKDAVPRLALDSHIQGSSTTDSVPGKSVTLNVSFELDNTGDVALRACSTLWQFTTLDGQPIMHHPSIVEPGGEKWSLAPGEVHVTNLSRTIKVGWEISDKAYMAIWFQCATRGVLTSAPVIGVDLGTGKIINDAVLGLKRLPPMDSRERGNLVDTRYGRPTTPPAPTEIPPYVADK